MSTGVIRIRLDTEGVDGLTSLSGEPRSEKHNRDVCCQPPDDSIGGVLIFLHFAGLSGARSAGLEPATFSVRSHSPSGTRADTGGQGETKLHFYKVLALLEGQGGTGRDTRLRSNCGQNVSLSGLFGLFLG